jgi:proline iminopeptidase
MFPTLRTTLVALAIAAVPALARASDTAPSQATFPSHGATLAYTAYGNGPIVVVLAGGPGLNAAYVAPLARTIAGDGYRAIVLDQRGTGRSVAAGAARADLTMRGTVADIDALRLALHQERLTFVTHSFGGGMALAYAAAHPTRVAKMILIGSVGTDLAGVDVFGKILMTHLRASERAQYAAAQRADDGAKALDIQLLAEFDDRAKARETIAREPHPFLYPAISDTIYTDFAHNYHVARALGHVRAHVTLLTGSDDAARAMESTLRQAFPNATRTYVPHSGHWPWIENPAFFNARLRDAL